MIYPLEPDESYDAPATKTPLDFDALAHLIVLANKFSEFKMKHGSAKSKAYKKSAMISADKISEFCVDALIDKTYIAKAFQEAVKKYESQYNAIYGPHNEE